MGLFINTLPLRLDFDESGIGNSVPQTHARLAELLRHEHASLALALALAVALAQRSSGVLAPFSALLNYRHNRSPSAVEDGSIDDPLHEVQWLGGEERTNYALALSVEDFGHALGLTAWVNTPHSPERICTYMQQPLEQLVHALEHTPFTPVNRLEVLSPSERE